MVSSVLIHDVMQYGNDSYICMLYVNLRPDCIHACAHPYLSSNSSSSTMIESMPVRNTIHQNVHASIKFAHIYTN